MDARDYRESETLKDGTPVTVRSIRAEDGESVLEAFKGMDKDSGVPAFLQPEEGAFAG